MKEIQWSDFEMIELRVGTIIHAQEFPEARNPAYIISVDFGEEIGIKKTSAQITALYSCEELTGKQVMGVVNFPNKQIGKMMSEFLLTGFCGENGEVVLAVPERPVKNGGKLA